MAKLFFLLSGENETLPASELTAILEAEGYAFELKEKLDQGRLDSAQNSVKAVHRRSAYTRISALELFTCEAQESEIMKAADSTNFQNVLNEGESFAVRIKRVRTTQKKSALWLLKENSANTYFKTP